MTASSRTPTANQSARRYAEGTVVSEEKSRIELELLLRRHGATNVITASADKPEPAALVQFTLAGRLIRFVRPYDALETERQRLAERRRCWRVLILWAKARLEAIAGGDSTAEAEFMHWIALPSGQTVGDWIGPQLAHAYGAGAMPDRLLLPSGGAS